MPDAVRAQLSTVLFDIDDTLTTDGRLTSDAYAALASLHAAGWRTIPITGRPAGWCDHIARMWPVDAVVGENGAFYMRYDRAARRLNRRFVDDAATRAGHRARLVALADRILREVPGSALASDQAYRETDLAIDVCEDVAPLSDAAVDRVLGLMRDAGLSAKVSSIHVNGWFGGYDKLATTQRVLEEQFGIGFDDARRTCTFVGDSPNDAPMFAAFPQAVGVANIERFVARLTALPAYVTQAESGAGFAELARFLLAGTPHGVGDATSDSA